MFPAGVIFLLLGAAVWYLSRVGFTVGSHPFCRACGFDLYKLPEDSRRCPECGADILAGDAITIGHRRPAGWGMAAGGAGAAIGALLLLLATVAWWNQFDGSRFKSVGMLQREAFLPETRTRARACAELQRRIERQALTGTQMERLAQEVVKRQADPRWDPHWGDLVQTGHRNPAGNAPLLSDDLWTQFLRQGMDITARARPKVRRGDPVPIAVTCRLKVGTAWLSPTVTFLPEVTAACGGAAGRLSDRPQACDFPVPLVWTVYWPPAPALAAGAQDVKVAVTITARDGRSTVARTTSFVLPVQVVERNESSVALRPPTAEGRREFAAALHWRLGAAEDGTISLAGGALGKLWVSSPPVTAACRVVLRQGQGDARHEWVIGRFLVQPEDAATMPLRLPAGGGPVPGEAEIVCVPDATLAEGTVDVLEVWGEEAACKIQLAP